MENNSFIPYQDNLSGKFQTEPSIRSLKKVPNFCKEMIKNWAKCLSFSPYLPSEIPSQFLWFNSNIKIDKKEHFYLWLCE